MEAVSTAACMSFTNLYYKRTTGTPKACYVCYKPTTTVLATINTVDFLYTCSGHLTDNGFATKMQEEVKSTPSASAEEIAKVKAEYEEKQKKKAEKEKPKGESKAEDDDKGKSKDKDTKDETKSGAKSPTTSTPAAAASGSSSGSSTPSHERYSLHRDFFAMRQAEHRKRRQVAQAKELAPKLPSAPSGGL